VLPAALPPATKTTEKTFSAAVLGVGTKTVAQNASGDMLKLSPTATAALKPQVVGVQGNGVQAGGFSTASGLNTKYADTSGISFIGNALIMGYNAVKGGQAAAPIVGQLVEAVKKFDLDGLWTGGKALGSVGLQFAGKSAGFAGGLSLLLNGWRVINHQQSIPVAGARVVGDTMGGFAGGFGGAIAGGIGLTLLGALGIAGAPLTIGAALVGAIGYHFADKAIRQTGAYNWVVQNTYDLLQSMDRTSVSSVRR